MPDPSPDADPAPEAGQPVGTPRWVKVIGVVVLVLVLLVAVLHLTGNSPGGPRSHLGGLHAWVLRP